MAPRVVCVGIAVLDEIYSIPTLPLREGKHFAGAYREVGGGPAATSAVAIQKLGGQASLWTRLGDDRLAKIITDELSEYGVNTDFCRQFANCRSSISAVGVDPNGGRAIMAFADPNLPCDPGWLPLERLTGIHAIVGDLRWPEGTLATFKAALNKNIPTVLDADQTPEKLSEIFYQSATHILFSRPGLVQFSGHETIEDGLRHARHRLNGWIGVSDGAYGVYWLERGDIRHLKAFAVKAIDTLGAGDVLHGAFALALARGEKGEDALRYACAAAALKCTKPGGRAGIPNDQTVREFLKGRGENETVSR